MSPDETAVKILQYANHTTSSMASRALHRAIADAIRAAVADEREMCAKLAEETKITAAMGLVLCKGEQIAELIRGRL